MARIRSIHPGIFTDEAYMALSFPARELIKGLWCEADDQGIFELKPLTLKARLMPADAVDILALISELEAGRFLKQYEVSGKWYGAIRNFRRFQRPKKPKHVHIMPPEFRTYVGLNEDGSPPSDDEVPEVPQKEEQPPQREEGGCMGRRDSDSEKEFKNSDSEGIEEDDPLDVPKFLRTPSGAVHLKGKTFEQARELAPRYDLYHIEQCWREWNGDKLAGLKDPDKAFLGFVRKHVEANPI